MRRVFLLNNYSMNLAVRRVAAAEYPGQHLWGQWELRNTYDWIIPPRSVAELPAAHGIRRRLLTALLPIVGDLLQQAHVLRTLKPGDIVYAADQQSGVGLALLRKLRLLRNPVVVMIHNGPKLAWTRWCYRGADQLLCLSEGIRERLIAQMGLAAESVLVMPWGPSLTSPFYARFRHAATPDLDFVAAGKTNRDYAALEQVATEQKRDGIIFGPNGMTTFTGGVATLRPGLSDYEEVLHAMERARWVVVPLADPTRLSGLTEVADAMALRIPTAITPTPIFPMADAAYPVITDLTDADAVASLLASEPPAASSVDGVRARFEMAVFARELEAVFTRVSRASGS